MRRREGALLSLQRQLWRPRRAPAPLTNSHTESLSIIFCLPTYSGNLGPEFILRHLWFQEAFLKKKKKNLPRIYCHERSFERLERRKPGQGRRGLCCKFEKDATWSRATCGPPSRTHARRRGFESRLWGSLPPRPWGRLCNLCALRRSSLEPRTGKKPLEALTSEVTRAFAGDD